MPLLSFSSTLSNLQLVRCKQDFLDNPKEKIFEDRGGHSKLKLYKTKPYVTGSLNQLKLD